ncbi:hypothetical protein GGR51DRAFT_514512 [Nemania sp. FL0031]|nr:hypothetical protein GGR51DRAFT_514512 [Nemania sp. FL0031]
MRHTPCLFTPARALHRILLLELANTTSKSTAIPSTILPCSSSPLLNHTILPPSNHPRIPSATPPTPCRRPRFFTTKSRAPTFTLPRKFQKTQPENQDIPYRWVRIASADGTLSPPQAIASAISQLPENHSLVMVAPPPPPSPRLLTGPPAAICRIVDVVAQAAAAREAEREAKRTAQQTKTLELNWAIAAHDLGHKTARLRAFLEKGMRVELWLARKRGSRQATKAEGEELIKSIREAALGVDGATEYRKMTGEVNGVVNMYFEAAKNLKKKKKKKGEEEEEGEKDDEEE